MVFEYTLTSIVAGGTATGIGLIVQKIRGGWPFTELTEQKHYYRDNFLEQISRPIRGKGTPLHLRPIFKFTLKDDGTRLTAPRIPQEIVIPNFEFVAQGNYQGKLNVNARVQVEDDAANDFRYRADADFSQVDNFIRGELSALLGKTDPNELRRDLKGVSKTVEDYLNEKEEEEDEDGRLYKNTGTKLASMNLAQLQWDDRSSEILLKPERARQEAVEQKIQSEAPARTWGIIYDGLKEEMEQRGLHVDPADLARRTDEMYHDQRIFEYTQNPGSTVIIDSEKGKEKRPLPIGNSFRQSEPQTPQETSQTSQENPQESGETKRETEEPQQPSQETNSNKTTGEKLEEVLKK